MSPPRHPLGFPPVRLRCRVAAAILLRLGGDLTRLSAQGVTGAGLEGRVTGPDTAVAEAVVVVTNAATGERWRTATSGDGRYAFERLSVGGPYRLEVRAIGFAPADQEGLTLALGERRRLDLALRPSAQALAPIEVHTAAAAPAGHGPGRIIDAEEMARLPLLNRDVLELVRASPHAVGTAFGVAIGGQGPRDNAFQVDGGDNANLYGQFAQTPGGLINLIAPPGGGGLRSVSLDAVQEIEILVAPFDVRQGGFTGGLINAVTRSGTNTVHGSAFTSLQTRWLAGRDPNGARLPEFHTIQFGGTVGAPIVRDRVHLFLSADLQASVTPSSGPLIGADTTGGLDSIAVGIRYPSAVRFQRILADSYGVDAGGLGPLDTRNPAQSLFGKFTLVPGVNSRIEVSQSYVHGALEGFLAERDHGLYSLSSTDGRYTSTTMATRGSWHAIAGRRLSNELTAAYLTIRDLCRPAAVYPLVRVEADGGTLQAGRSTACPGQALTQHALEVTDNVTMHRGAHRLLLGTHNELLAFRDPPSSPSAWGFASLDDLAAGHPDEFQRPTTGPLRPEGNLADFRVRQVGVYLQDDWSPGARLRLTLGLRMDVPFFPDRPALNPDLLRSALGIDTGHFPSGQILWSPRFGASYALGSAVTLRGGVGLFTGRPPYFMPADAYRSTGLEQYFVGCVGADVPDFTLDPSRQPTACRSTAAGSLPRITYVDPSYHFPQELKLSAGLDAALPLGVAATLDLLVSRARYQPDFVDMNLRATGARLAGEGGRVLYGSIDPTGEPTPNRPVGGITSVVRQGNGHGNNDASVSLGVAKRWSAGAIEAAYSYGESRDRMNPPAFGFSGSGLGLAADQIAGTAVDGTLERRRLARSVFDVPHKLRASATIPFPSGLALSLIYEGSSGSPFTYVVDGDINADGFGRTIFGQMSNDPVYVPAAAVPGGEVVLADPAGAAAYDSLARYIRSEPCLRRARGSVLHRNTCRNPWRTQLDARLATTVRLEGRAVGLALDVFNLPHLLNRDWGLVRRTADFGLEEVPLLELVGFDAEGQRGIYRLALPHRRAIDAGQSRWRMQLGARVGF